MAQPYTITCNNLSNLVSSFSTRIPDDKSKQNVLNWIKALINSKERFDVKLYEKRCTYCNSNPCFGNAGKYFYYHSCGTCYCNICFRIECNKVSEETYDGRIYNMLCKNCNRLFDYEFVDILFPVEIKNRIIEEIEEKRQDQTCSICYERFTKKNIIILDCSHKVCPPCLNIYLHNLINEGKVSGQDLSCPDCSESLLPSIIQRNVSSEDWDKITIFTLNLELMKIKSKIDNKLIKCPRCSLFVDVGSDMYIISCYKCKTRYCVFCQNEHDEQTTCAEYSNWQIENNQSEKLYNELVEKRKNEHKFKDCPNCSSMIEKSEGCNHMQCFSPQCKGNVHFCFICGTLYINKKAQCKCPLFSHDS